jgi:DNA polymerase-3 subunit epsilon
MKREVVLDTETTGVDARNGDRIIEIGCVELVNHCPTGRSFHAYLNPGRPVSDGAFAVHGLSDAFLADKPRFADVADAFTDFIAEARLVIHNAPFDVGFLDMELTRVGKPRLEPQHVVDTLLMARRKHPGASNSLDALCARYGIDTTRRVKHGALLDAEILSDVYIELLGGRQTNLGLAAPAPVDSKVGPTANRAMSALRRTHVRTPRVTPAEQEAHAALVAALTRSAAATTAACALWTGYLGQQDKAAE